MENSVEADLEEKALVEKELSNLLEVTLRLEYELDLALSNLGN